jgi:hypothetical protein
MCTVACVTGGVESSRVYNALGPLQTPSATILVLEAMARIIIHGTNLIVEDPGQPRTVLPG